jgi:hypothetical protein
MGSGILGIMTWLTNFNPITLLLVDTLTDEHRAIIPEEFLQSNLYQKAEWHRPLQIRKDF